MQINSYQSIQAMPTAKVATTPAPKSIMNTILVPVIFPNKGFQGLAF